MLLFLTMAMVFIDGFINRVNTLYYNSKYQFITEYVNSDWKTINCDKMDIKDEYLTSNGIKMVPYLYTLCKRINDILDENYNSYVNGEDMTCFTFEFYNYYNKNFVDEINNTIGVISSHLLTCDNLKYVSPNELKYVDYETDFNKLCYTYGNITMLRYYDNEMKIKRMLTKDDILNKRIDMMEANMNLFKNEYDTVNSKVDNLQSEYSTVNDKVDSLQSEYSTVNNKVESLQSEYDTVNNKVDNLQSDKDTRHNKLGNHKNYKVSNNK